MAIGFGHWSCVCVAVRLVAVYVFPSLLAPLSLFCPHILALGDAQTSPSRYTLLLAKSLRVQSFLLAQFLVAPDNRHQTFDSGELK